MRRLTFAVLSLFVASSARADAPAEPDLDACRAKDADACFRLGTRAAAADDNATAAKRFAGACDAGHGLACVYMAENYETKAAKQARWLKKAQPAFERRCAARDAEHCYYLGIAYERGRGARRDPAKSFAAYQRSCDLGFQFGCTNLAGSYLDGNGTKKDPVPAAELYTLGCRKGDDHACYMLGRIHAGETRIAEDRSHVEQVDLSKSASVNVISDHKPGAGGAVPGGPVIAALFKTANAAALEKACDAKSGLDCYLLGLMTYVGGGGVTKDAAKSAELYRRACEAGSGWGCFDLGDLYMRGYGVKQSAGDAAHYYLEVCGKRVGGEANFVEECNAITDRMGL